jgi:hypothetical protein
MPRLMGYFNIKYLLLTVLLFITEVIIAVYIHDAIIRPFGGDFFVVILIYCFVKTFVNAPVNNTALAVLLFAYLVEISQYFHLIRIMELENSKAARIIMGTSFSWADMLMYTLGITLVVMLEHGFTGASKLKTEDK